MRIAVLGYIIRVASGGLCFHHLQYVLSLKKLGHEVLFYEDSDDYPGEFKYDLYGEGKNTGLSFITKLFDYYNLKEQWTYFESITNKWFGVAKEKALDFISTADVLLNLSGINPERDWWQKIPVRAFVDTDPAFTQIKHLNDETLMKLAKAHTCHFTFAENIESGNCTIPKDGLNWKPTRQPIALDIWNDKSYSPSGKWTTVMAWSSYFSQTYNGIYYGMKSLSFKDYLTLPKKVNEHFELAIKADIQTWKELTDNGWQLIKSTVPTETFFAYQNYIQGSKGEWSVAKHGYVITNSGWFSERSGCYLASAKPVVVQETGFSSFLPTGEGLFAFSTLNEAIEQLNRVASDYYYHCRKAREIAEAYFGGEMVMKDLLERVN